MAINVVYQPPAGEMGAYAYQTSAVKQARDNLDTSIQRGMQAGVQNQQNAAQFAALDQRGQQFAAERQDMYAYRQAQIGQQSQQDYLKSRSDFDDVVEDGVKNGWLRLEPEQKQTLRKLNAADSEIMMSDQYDDATKMRMLHAIQSQRRSVIPTVIPGFDRPTKMADEALNNTFIVGPDGVTRPPQPGVPLRQGDQIYFMGKRAGAMTPVSMMPKEQKATKTSDKYWSPDLDFSSKYGMASKELKSYYDNYADSLKEQYAAALTKNPGDPLGGIAGGKVSGPVLTQTPGGWKVSGERVYDLSKPAEQQAFAFSAAMLKSPGVAFGREHVLRKMQEFDADHIEGQTGPGAMPETQPAQQAPQGQPGTEAMPIQVSSEQEALSLPPGTVVVLNGMMQVVE